MRSHSILLTLSLVFSLSNACLAQTGGSRAVTPPIPPGSSRSPAAAAAAPGQAEAGPEARVVLATSGGISLGSYMAGVNWGLVELIRRAQIDDTLQAVIARSGMLRPRIVGVSGASAGTINSLLSAVHYCTAAPLIPPEQSLFWRTWVDVGWRTLLPRGSRVQSPEFGLIDRAYFSDVLLPRIQAALEQPGRPGCAVEVAASLTRQRAVTEAVFDYVNINVQRHVATWALHADSTSGVMQLRQASAALRTDRSIGVQIALAPSRATATLDVRQVFDLAQASSAIPFVFAPVELSYYRAAELDASALCPSEREHGHGCAPPQRARFVDGGAFDNRPIGVADRLLAASRTQLPLDSNSVLRTIFIVPSAQRSGGVVNVDTASERVGGTTAATQFLSGMWGAASAYELHTYARSRAVDADRQVAVADTVEVTSRALPIFGETLHNFGAFLARPFREHDFYVGVYDAMHFAADRLCGTSAEQRSAPLEVRVSCHRTAFDAASHRVDIGCAGHLLLERFYLREHGVEPSEAFAAPECHPSDTARVALLADIADLYGETRAAPRKCPRTYSPMENVLCSSGLLAFTRAAKDGKVGARLRAWVAARPACQGTAPSADSTTAACFADEYFLRFLDNPSDFLRRLTFAGLERAAAVEAATSAADEAGYSSWFGIANAVLRSTLGRPTRSTLEWDVSSVPRECPDGNMYPRFGWCGAVQTFLRTAVPYYATIGFGAISAEAGVRPSWHTDAETSWVLPLSIHYGEVRTRDERRPGEPGERAYLSMGYGVAARNFSMLLNTCLTSVAWRTPLPWQRHEVRIPAGERLLYRFQCDALASRFSLGVSTTSFKDGARPWSFTIGVADLNGLLYWLLPRDVRTRF